MKLKTIALALPLLALAACGDSGPSADDVKDAYDSYLTKMVGRMNSGVVKIGQLNCAKLDDITYKCSFSYLLGSGESAEKTGLLEKAGGSWKYKYMRN